MTGNSSHPLVLYCTVQYCSGMSETRKVVEEFYRRAGAGEFDRIGALFADEVDWDVYGAAQVPWTGKLETGAEAAEFFRKLPEHLEPRELTVHRILVDGEDAVAVGQMRHVVRASGRTFNSRFAFW